MKTLTLKEIAKAVNGSIITGNDQAEITGVSTDSRTVKKGDLFIALIGARSDAHDYLPQVAKAGAKAVIVSDREKTLELLKDEDVTAILVEDTLQALLDLGGYYLRSLGLKHVIGVTGSVGKTSTKDFLGGVLNEKFRTVCSTKNHNSVYGLPLCIFELDPEAEAAVLEMGITDRDSMSKLADMVRPEAAVISNIGISHLEYFPEEKREGILKAKLSVTRYFSDDSVLAINCDNDILHELDLEERAIKGRLLKVGTEPGNDFVISDIRDKGVDGIEFSLTYEQKTYNICLGVPGAHNALNGSLAIALGVNYGLTMEEAIRGLENTQITEHRLDVKEVRGIKIIDDSYNAAPDSMKSAMNTLMSTPVPENAKHVAILGDIGELGSEREAGHRAVGEYAFA
ncbi:MAG: UDP-N-acetylmuramoyl-tripeptide--D-alanyl-D-alanine ligase, partial [Firmicutes bacterium]|nr:UDP-N-acetylmuramoyl-tripeptide--D-alanyl-D-alanine ligase [Bacillota bacterium]